jgi:hypothetical protein
MGRFLVLTWMAAAASLAAGCMHGPLVENPVFIDPDPSIALANPLWIPPGAESYNKVFERILSVVGSYFEIAASSRWDGRIETLPRIAPGYEQFWKPGNPDPYYRLLATLQTIRQRGVIQIQPAADGGFFVQVTIYRELEDLPRPSYATAGAAAFRSENDVERQFEVIDLAFPGSNVWIPIGRDEALEQLILQRIKKCL